MVSQRKTDGGRRPREARAVRRRFVLERTRRSSRGARPATRARRDQAQRGADGGRGASAVAVGGRLLARVRDERRGQSDRAAGRTRVTRTPVDRARRARRFAAPWPFFPASWTGGLP